MLKQIGWHAADTSMAGNGRAFLRRFGVRAALRIELRPLGPTITNLSYPRCSSGLDYLYYH